MMKVHHVGYLVRQLGKAEEGFSLLGYTEKQPAVYDQARDVDISFWEKDGYTVELVSPRSERSIVAGLIKKYKNAPYHICYETDNFRRDLSLLEESGFLRIAPLAPAPAISGGAQVLFLYSAQIGLVELLTYEQLSDQGTAGGDGCMLFCNGDGGHGAEIPGDQRGCKPAP